MLDGKLTMWTIYHYPGDWPHVPYVIRCDLVAGGVVTDTRERWLRETIDQAREVIHFNDPTATIRMERHPNDVACVVETWM